MERTVPSTHEIEVVLRNPLDKDQKLSYYIEVENTDFNQRWLELLEENLKTKRHLEKNFCWLGWADSPRNGEYLCNEINKVILQINNFNDKNIWQKNGLNSYVINEKFDLDKVIQKGEVDFQKPGLKINHEIMNLLHRWFEDLQGETWNISKYYKLADYETKYAIRQLNVLCHELESWVISNRKKIQEPKWQRPSQITTFLNAPRKDLLPEDYNLFLKNRYDRELGGVYLHWAQVGKTLFEVFRDEDGAKLDNAVCSAINHLKFFSGEFDIDWGVDICEANRSWHRDELVQFRKWLVINGFDWNDAKLALGHIKIGQVNLKKSFGTEDFFKIIDKLKNFLDIYQIKTNNVSATFNYTWSDPNYKQIQIDFLKPGYDWSKNNA